MRTPINRDDPVLTLARHLQEHRVLASAWRLGGPEGVYEFNFISGQTMTSPNTQEARKLLLAASIGFNSAVNPKRKGMEF